MEPTSTPILGRKVSHVLDVTDEQNGLTVTLYRVTRARLDGPISGKSAVWHVLNEWHLTNRRDFAEILQDIVAGIGRAAASELWMQLSLPFTSEGGTVPPPEDQ